MSKILVVDDDRDLREDLGEILNEAGFAARLAEDGLRAIELLETDEFGLVLLDCIMPGMGGMETLTRIKRVAPKTRVIMMTAFSTIDSAVEAMRKGADDYITKPFKIDDLLMAIRRCLEEAKFADCGPGVNMDEMFKCLSNATRRQVLVLLRDHATLRFMDIVRGLEIDDHTKVNFHLRILKEADLLTQDSQKNYQLSAKGKNVITCLSSIASL